MPGAAARGRRHDLDALRGFAMLLGVLWHVVFFAPVEAASGATAFVTDGFLFGSHAVRMPLFFLVAGFFGAMVVAGQGGAGWLRGRLKRLGIPFLVGMVTVVPAFRAAAALGDARRSGAPLDVDVAGWVTFGPAHLWFLEELLILCGLALLVRRVVRAPRLSPAWLPALVLATAAALWALSRSPQGPLHGFVPAPASLALHGIFFTTGWLAYRQGALLSALGRRPLVLLAAAVAATCALAAGHEFRSDFGREASIVAVLLEAMACWAALGALLGLFWRLLSSDRPAIRYLADASYWLYLCHLPLVVLLLVAFENTGAPLELVAPLVFALTCATLLVSYQAFVRHGPIGRVLHGPRSRERQHVVEEPHAVLPAPVLRSPAVLLAPLDDKVSAAPGSVAAAAHVSTDRPRDRFFVERGMVVDVEVPGDHHHPEPEAGDEQPLAEKAPAG